MRETDVRQLDSCFEVVDIMKTMKLRLSCRSLNRLMTSRRLHNQPCMQTLHNLVHSTLPTFRPKFITNTNLMGVMRIILQIHSLS